MITHKLSTPNDILRSYIHALVIASLGDKSKSVHMESRLWMEENYGVLISKVLFDMIQMGHLHFETLMIDV
ncbi:hypothetical protein QJS04_geneDACA025112 [Acorus gramineus]|uniref:Uncharacterized protein n=1 Tax=Acorus gramineus TaxID=55184 RepID=A0AAV9BX76_ACOGR|nr:hypothetical protein QJS04_geneDACA025112 [Acorus gramineus]